MKLLKSSFSHRLLKFTRSFKPTNVVEKNIVFKTKNNKNNTNDREIKPILPNDNFKNK